MRIDATNAGNTIRSTSDAFRGNVGSGPVDSASLTRPVAPTSAPEAAKLSRNIEKNPGSAFETRKTAPKAASLRVLRSSSVSASGMAVTAGREDVGGGIGDRDKPEPLQDWPAVVRRIDLQVRVPPRGGQP